MARIQGVTPKRFDLATRFAYWYSRRKTGKVMEPVRIASHHFWIRSAYGAYELLFERGGKVDLRYRRLAALKAAAMVGCHW